MNNGIIFPVQSKTKDEQKNPKDLHGIKIRKILSKREEGMQRNVLDPMSWKEFVYFDVGYSSFTSQFDFEVSSFCTGLDVRWSHLLWSNHRTCDTLWLTGRVSGQGHLVKSFPWISLLQNHKSTGVSVNDQNSLKMPMVTNLMRVCYNGFDKEILLFLWHITEWEEKSFSL